MIRIVIPIDGNSFSAPRSSLFVVGGNFSSSAVRPPLHHPPSATTTARPERFNFFSDHQNHYPNRREWFYSPQPSVFEIEEVEVEAGSSLVRTPITTHSFSLNHHASKQQEN